MQYTPWDQQVSGGVTLEIGGGSVNFQFPPKIASDGQSGDWNDEVNAAGSNISWEPIVTYKGARPRGISLEWTYIVDGDEWDPDSIAANLRLVRGYYRGPQFDGGGGSKLIGMVKLWKHGGSGPISCRLVDTNIKHSGPIVSGPFHLRTDVTVSLKIWGIVGNMPPLFKELKKIGQDWY